VVSSGTLGPVHIKVHCDLHDAVQLINGIVSPSVTVYIVVDGDRITYSDPSTRNRYSPTIYIKTMLSMNSGIEGIIYCSLQYFA
jgi:hypothetical protein